MEELDLRVRNDTYRRFVELGRAPRLEEIDTVGKLCELGHAWWHDRLSPDWRPHTRAQNQAILDSLGLTGSFWRLP